MPLYDCEDFDNAREFEELFQDLWDKMNIELNKQFPPEVDCCVIDCDLHKYFCRTCKHNKLRVKK